MARTERPTPILIATRTYLLWCFLNRQTPQVNELAQRLCIPPTRLRNQIRRATGVTAGVYLKSIQLSLAKLFLRHTAVTLPEIAQRCGYGSAVTFHRTFQRELGCTPETFRRQVRRGWRQRHTRPSERLAPRVVGVKR